MEKVLPQTRTEAEALEDLSKQFGLPIWQTLPQQMPALEFTERIPARFLKKHLCLPLETEAERQNLDTDADGEDKTIQWVVAVNDPTNFQPVDNIARLLAFDDYQLVLATKEMIIAGINRAYDHSRGSAEQIVQDMAENGATIISEIEDIDDLLDDTSDAPIIKLVNHVISQSVKARASDIHFEPYQNGFKVRYRIDGILYDLIEPPKWVQPALISRIKVMAKMDIAEKRLPQDGRLEVKIGARDIDVRVSTIPTAFGERCVLRLLNKTDTLFRLTELGLSPANLDKVKKLVKSNNGIILVTGPTGSGKTTTLYAVLSSINTPDINIITIEDPIEYQLNGIGQIQVNPKIDLTFAKGLRSIVRQDPDVVLVGEIRDQETAEIAVQSALTGHLVFSTLHTNDAPGAITRLIDIGVEPFLISSSVVAVIAQRLVRVLCTDCRKPYTLDAVAAEKVGLKFKTPRAVELFRAGGCKRCLNTGYSGRIGIFEFMTLSDELKTLLIKTHDAVQIKKYAVSQSMETLRQDGLRKVLNGITTIEEVLRVTQQ
jgi:general secretion pathway protein E